ncbi:MAG: UDP-N-acetylmuramoyl-L-alanine--D-glutamate ligase [Helicobacter sp.]|nr:UDP-N-acetylmuramoyl-L-alanine--D-glutamate ligase [Helicobacter sp.]
MKIALLGNGKSTKAIIKRLKNTQFRIFDDAIKEPFCAESSDAESSDEGGKNAYFPSSFFDANNFDLQIISPGIPQHHFLAQKAINKISEYDFFYDELKSHFNIWISGTNGKTTTTRMLEFLLNLCAVKYPKFSPFLILPNDTLARTGGNIGYPIAQILSESENKGENKGILILETSSFMLHYTKRAFPQIYALLNVAQDHIDWHQNFENYLHAKLEILKRMPKDTLAILPKSLNVPKTEAKLVFFDDHLDLAKLCGLTIADLTQSSSARSSNPAQSNSSVHLGSQIFKEPFLQDALVALFITKHIFKDIDLKEILEDFAHFKIDSNRLEEFVINGVLYVNDSKATNVSAALVALERYKNKDLYVILGGEDKGADLDELIRKLEQIRPKIFLIGKNAQRLAILCQNLDFILCKTLDLAMHEIRSAVAQSKNACVLLSPAAASTDQFSSYAARGDRFIELAKGKS